MLADGPFFFYSIYSRDLHRVSYGSFDCVHNLGGPGSPTVQVSIDG